ncbi:glycosyl transferase [Bacteroidia bacterium]|nr:glycosyl transferase [Bacteroidia bacterium]
MKISIITIAYNSAQTIEDTIQSVLQQTYPDVEYVVIDGGSKDLTVNIIKKNKSKFNGRMRWISECDNGVYDAMNKGILLATGDVIGFVNSDDMLCDEQAVEKVMKVFEQNDELDAVYADVFYVAQNDTSKIVRRWISGEQKPFKSGWHPAHPTLYIKKSVYAHYGLFDLEYGLAADFEIMLRFLDKYKIKVHYLKESLVKMRLGGATNKNIKNIYIGNIECLRAFKKNNLPVNPILYPILRLLPKLLQFF